MFTLEIFGELGRGYADLTCWYDYWMGDEFERSVWGVNMNMNMNI